MSDRSVSENRELWEAAERVAEEVVAAKKAESEAERQKQKKRVIKLVLLMTLIALIIIFASVAWFAQNKSVSADTMAIEAKGDAYSIQPLGDKAGLYDTYIDDLGVEAIKWALSSSDNMKNRYSESGQPNSSEMAEITRLDSEQYGLKPGDSGSLQFRVTSTSTSAITVSFGLACTGYKATYGTDNYKTNDSLVEVTNATVNSYLASHILFFYADASNNLHLLTSDGFSASLTAGQSKDITIYWLWPATLKEILDENITGLSDSGAAKEVKRYFFEHPEFFLKPVTGDDFSDFTVTKRTDTSAEDDEIEEKMSYVSGKNYSQYGSKYNDADQAIGDHINFLLVELTSGIASGG